MRASGNFGYRTAIPAADGTFSIMGNTCDAGDIELVGYDLTASKGSTPQTIPYSATIDVGNLVACDVDLVSFARFTTDQGDLITISPVTIDIFDVDVASNGQSVVLINFSGADVDAGGSNEYDFAILFTNNTVDTSFYAMDSQVLATGNAPPTGYQVSGEQTLTELIPLPVNQPGEIWQITVPDMEVRNLTTDNIGTTDFECRLIID